MGEMALIAGASLGAISAILMTIGAALRIHRQARMRRTAHRLGLRYQARATMSDVGTTAFPFLSRGVRHRVRDVVTGTIDEQPVLAFTYTYTERLPAGDGGHLHGGHRLSAARFRCAILSIDTTADHPLLRIERVTPELYGIYGRIRRIDPGPGVENQTLQRGCDVRCDDDGFARTVIDHRVEGWLLDRSHPLTIELFQGSLLFALPAGSGWQDGGVVHPYVLALALRRHIADGVLRSAVAPSDHDSC